MKGLTGALPSPDLTSLVLVPTGVYIGRIELRRLHINRVKYVIWRGQTPDNVKYLAFNRSAPRQDLPRIETREFGV
jgi:hypothetical protein